eukprot:COSAG02_NODE_556_length_20390_cov_88.575230_8_plen_92_part_00
MAPHGTELVETIADVIVAALQFGAETEGVLQRGRAAHKLVSNSHVLAADRQAGRRLLGAGGRIMVEDETQVLRVVPNPTQAWIGNNPRYFG